MLKQIVNKLLYSGNSWINYYEVASIVLFYKLMNDADKVILESQLKKLDLVQRSPNGKIVTFFSSADMKFLRWNGNILFSNTGEAVTACKLKFSLSKTKISGALLIHHGHLASIQYVGKITPEMVKQKFKKIYSTEEYLNMDLEYIGCEDLGSTLQNL